MRQREKFRKEDSFELIREQLTGLYGKEEAARLYDEILPRIEACGKEIDKDIDGEPGFSQGDVVLVTYGDSLRREGEAETPLARLHRFACTHLREIISAVHILPCFPYSSDDGFSVMDYRTIDPALGSWDDIRRLGGDFRLMLDLVLNHISARSDWFRSYLAGEEGFEDLAMEVDPASDLSAVTRPRSHPLLTAFRKANGETVHLWTTFSDDQVDLNFKRPGVLLRMLDVLLLYAARGASMIRLDAVAYLWKEIGTPCIHLPRTHLAVKLLRTVFNAVRPDGLIITETNVPHEENLSYFGNGDDEAQMVYNFTLPPLLLYTFMTGDSTRLTGWARGLELPSPQTTFFNFTASHDGIGVRPLEGIVPADELETIIAAVREKGGTVSYKRNPDGSESPYELNITYVDALWAGEGDGYHVERFLASQAVQLVLPGVPGIYIHSLLGSRNWTGGVRLTGRARTINREKLDPDTVADELARGDSFRGRVFRGYSHMLRIRRQQPAFHPNAAFEIPVVNPAVFAVVRRAPGGGHGGGQVIHALTNVTAENVRVSFGEMNIPAGPGDLLTGKQWTGQGVELPPYGVVWLTHG